MKRVNVEVGRFYTKKMPCSEAMMHCGLADEWCRIGFDEHGRLFVFDSLHVGGQPFTPGEAGIMQDEDGYYFYEEESCTK